MRDIVCAIKLPCSSSRIQPKHSTSQNINYSSCTCTHDWVCDGPSPHHPSPIPAGAHLDETMPRAIRKLFGYKTELLKQDNTTFSHTAPPPTPTGMESIDALGGGGSLLYALLFAFVALPRYIHFAFSARKQADTNSAHLPFRMTRHLQYRIAQIRLSLNASIPPHLAPHHPLHPHTHAEYDTKVLCAEHHPFSASKWVTIRKCVTAIIRERTDVAALLKYVISSGRYGVHFSH